MKAFTAVQKLRDRTDEQSLTLASLTNFLSRQEDYPHRVPEVDPLRDEFEAYLQENPVAARIRVGLVLTGERMTRADALYIRGAVVDALEAEISEAESKRLLARIQRNRLTRAGVL